MAKILILEDNKVCALMYAYKLNKNDANQQKVRDSIKQGIILDASQTDIVVANSPEQLYRHIILHKHTVLDYVSQFDMIITDQHMEFETTDYFTNENTAGSDFIRNIREEGFDKIIIANSSDERNKTIMLEAGANSFISKDLRALCEEVNIHIKPAIVAVKPSGGRAL